MANRKYNASGMSEPPKLNHAQLYNGPPAEGGSQPNKPRFTGTMDDAVPGDKGAGVRIRETPATPQPLNGKVEPNVRAVNQPNGTVHST